MRRIVMMSGWTFMLVTLAATGCGTGNGDGEEDSDSTAVSTETAVRRMWKLERFGPAAHMLGSEAEVMAALAALPADRSVTLDLTAEGRVAGASGCNRFSGEFRVEPGNEVVIGPVAGTRMACDEATMILESTFLRTLGSVTRASVRHDRLELHGEAGVLLAFILWEGAESIP